MAYTTDPKPIAYTGNGFVDDYQFEFDEVRLRLDHYVVKDLPSIRLHAQRFMEQVGSSYVGISVLLPGDAVEVRSEDRPWQPIYSLYDTGAVYALFYPHDELFVLRIDRFDRPYVAYAEFRFDELEVDSQ